MGIRRARAALTSGLSLSIAEETTSASASAILRAACPW